MSLTLNPKPYVSPLQALEEQLRAARGELKRSSESIRAVEAFAAEMKNELLRQGRLHQVKHTLTITRAHGVRLENHDEHTHIQTS